jgi:hypothetical protein
LNNPLTDDDIIMLGTYCEGLLREELFNVLVKQFELNCFDHMMSSAAHETKKREGVFATYQGLKDFLGLMITVVAQKNKLTEEPSAKDAQEDEID